MILLWKKMETKPVSLVHAQTVRPTCSQAPQHVYLSSGSCSQAPRHLYRGELSSGLCSDTEDKEWVLLSPYLQGSSQLGCHVPLWDLPFLQSLGPDSGCHLLPLHPVPPLWDVMFFSLFSGFPDTLNQLFPLLLLWSCSASTSYSPIFLIILTLLL